MYTLCVEFILHVCYLILITYSVLLYTVLCILRLLRSFISVPIVRTPNYEVRLVFSLFTKVHISNYGKSWHMYMYILSAKIRIGKGKKIQNLVLFKNYYTSSVIAIVITIDSYKGYKLGYNFRE